MVAFFPPVLLMRRNVIRKKLTEAGATTPERALTLAEAGVINPYGFRRFIEFLVQKGFTEEPQITGTTFRACNNGNGVRL